MSGFTYSPAPDGTAESGGESSTVGTMALAARYMPSADSLKETAFGIFSKAQPWSDFLNTKQFSVPQASEVPDRLKENVQHYLYNYIIVFVILSIFLILTKPLSLVSVALVAVGYYRLYIMAGDDSVKLGPLELDTSMKKGLVLGLGGLLLFWITGAITGIMSLVGTVGLLGGLHALMRKPASEPDFESGFSG
eukprot:Plantae.Rhodophyta-Purpureofilum_apyrenoidigerum.ctg7043.p1 GENE.Plantae.Rhodophyta-Purpureofilum_apyrenoidigerum.ctg7043~~Plantae.Rhodophyta-Purpureofilum_apyrenoidigerum.ctg7043.p1  ORF type:complete len:193 (+),score=40.36 Plantae.Rhodophyta-Purpureofilum_apyrenoidigerum.ctg7043:228-806(+)